MFFGPRGGSGGQISCFLAPEGGLGGLEGGTLFRFSKGKTALFELLPMEPLRLGPSGRFSSFFDPGMLF